jgi:hypothetical protein
VGAGLEEGAGEAHHPFAAQRRAGVAAAGGEHHDAAVEVEVDDLPDLEQAVLVGGAGGEEHAGAVGVGLVGDGVGGEVEDAVAQQRGRLHESLGGGVPQPADAAAAEVAHHREALLPGVGEGAQLDAGSEDGDRGAIPGGGEAGPGIPARQRRIGQGERGDRRGRRAPSLPAQPEGDRGDLGQAVARGQRSLLGSRAQGGEGELVERVVRHQDQPPDAGRELAQRPLQQLPVEGRGGGGVRAVPAVESALEEPDRRPQLAPAGQTVDPGAAAGDREQPGAAREIPLHILPGGDLEGEQGLVRGEGFAHPGQRGEVGPAGGVEGRGGAGELVAQVRLLHLQPVKIPVGRGSLGGREGWVEQPALHGRDLLQQGAPLLADRGHGGRHRMGPLQGVDQRPGPHALRDLETAIEILRPVLLEGGVEQPSGEPVVVLGPGGEHPGLSGGAGLEIAQGLDGVERRAGIPDGLVASAGSPAHPHLLAPGERHGPGVSGLAGEGEGAVDRALRLAWIGQRDQAGESVQAVALVSRRTGLAHAGREVIPGRFAFGEDAQDQVRLGEDVLVVGRGGGSERLLGQAGDLLLSFLAGQFGGLVEHRASHAVARDGLREQILLRRGQPRQPAEGFEAFGKVAEIEIEVPQGGQAFPLRGVRPGGDERGFRLPQQQRGPFQILAGAPEMAGLEDLGAGEQLGVAGGPGDADRPVRLGSRFVDSARVEEQPVEIDPGENLALGVPQHAEAVRHPGELLDLAGISIDEEELDPGAPRMLAQQLLEPCGRPIPLLEGLAGFVEAAGRRLALRLSLGQLLAAVEARRRGCRGGRRLQGQGQQQSGKHQGESLLHATTRKGRPHGAAPFVIVDRSNLRWTGRGRQEAPCSSSGRPASCCRRCRWPGAWLSSCRS